MGDILRSIGERELITLDVEAKVGRATERFKEHGISQVPVLPIPSRSPPLLYISGMSSKNSGQLVSSARQPSGGLARTRRRHVSSAVSSGGFELGSLHETFS